MKKSQKIPKKRLGVQKEKKTTVAYPAFFKKLEKMKEHARPSFSSGVLEWGKRPSKAGWGKKGGQGALLVSSTPAISAGTS